MRPPKAKLPRTTLAGVLGALSGVMGSIQAIEVVKQILGIGDSLVRRLLLFDALSMEFRVVKLRQDPKCPLCGDDPSSQTSGRAAPPGSFASRAKRCVTGSASLT